MHGHQIEHELAQLVLTPKDAQSVSQLFYGPKPALIPPPALNPAFDDVQLTRRRLLRGTLFFFTVYLPAFVLSLRVKYMQYLQFLEPYFSAHVRHGPIAHDPKAGPRNSRHASPAR